MFIIGEIIESLIKDNIECGRVIIEETNFIEQFLSNLNELSDEQISKYLLYPLYNLYLNISTELKQ